MAVPTREAPPDGLVFEDIADAMPHMVWLAGPDGGSTYHNRRILEYAGLTAGVTLGAGWERLVHPDDVPATRATWLHSVGTGEPFETEYRLRRHDGAYRWFLARAHTQFDGRGEVVRWVGTCTDIEDQKGAESRFRAIIEKSFDAVDLVAPDGTILYSSPAGIRLLGYPQDEDVGRNGFELMHPDDVGRVRAEFERLLVTPGGSADTVHRARHRDGHYLWLEARATNLLHDPTVRAVVVNFRDVSDRVAAGDRVRASEARYRELFEANPHPMWVYDTETLRYLAVNDAAVERYGYSRDEFLAMTVADIRPPEDVPALLADVGRAADGLQSRGVWRHRWKDGTVREVEVSAHVLRFADRPARLVLALDVTDRVRAEAEAARGLARLRAVVDNMADGLVYADPAGNLLDWNPAALRMHGYATADEARRHLSEFAGTFTLSRPGGGPLPFRDWPMPRILRGEFVADETLVLRRSDTGLELVIEYTGVPVRGPDGRVELGVLTIHDVTRRARAEAEARRTAELLRAVADGTTDAVFVKDPDGKYLLANPATCRFLGRPAEEVLGRADAELFEPESARLVRGHDLRAMAADRAVTAEETLTAAGETRTFLVTKGPYRDAAGAVAGVIGISRDVTLKRQLAAERDALLARLQVQFERMPLAYVQFGADLRVTDWNPAAERIFGFRKDEVLGMGPPYEKIVPESFRAEAEPLLARIKAGDMAAHSVNPNLTRDGRTITCEWFNTPLLDEGGRFTGLLCLAQDLTARLLLEEQFRQAQKMEAFGQLAGGVAHDFNNLLTIINGYSDIVLGGLPPGDPNRELLAEVHKAGQRSAGLTRQLLAFSRQQVLALRVLDLNEVVGDTASMLRRVIGEDVKLSTTTASGLWPVKADPGQVEQILLNLAVNARDAMPTGGKLTIETSNVELDETYAASHPDARAGAHVRLAVSDTGCGMSAAVRAKIFEPFFTTKGPGKGTGLGLATVYGIVKQSGGHVGVYSEVGVGTTFKVYLPRTEPAGEGAKSHPVLRALPRGTETVLVVEDDAAVRGLTRHILQNAGYAVLEAAGGDEALRVAIGHTGRIHLLVTDVVMPGLGGRAAAERLAERHPGLRVLFVSGYTDDAVVRHGVLHDKVNFLQKPFTPAALAGKVREVLDQPSA